MSKNSSSDFWIAACTIARALTNGYGLVRSSIAYVIAGPKANSESESKYAPFSMSSSDTRQDAFRHILWSSLLAQNYFTLSSKSKRIGFSNLVTTKRETTCSDGVGNAIDAKEMDFHNNYIGREIWSQNTTYRTLFGWNVGLRRPSTSLLIDIAFSKVESRSCFVVSNKNFDDITDKNTHYNEIETKNIIPNMTPVYIKKPIINKQPIVTVTYDYRDCGGSSNNGGFDELTNVDKINGNNLDPSDPCIRKIYTTTDVDACFYSKNPNYNPY